MTEPNVIIAASILTADFLNLKVELDSIVKAKIPAVHFDVMDNNFVPNLSFGPKILSDVASYLKTKGVAVDCHLMVAIKSNIKVKDFLQPFILDGVNSITLHYEALSKKQLKEFLSWKNCGFKKGLAVSPETKINKIFPYLDLLDLVLIMSVHPGFGNQKFIDASYQKIQTLSDYCKNNNKSPIIAVDGGINDSTAKRCIEAGANYLVSGSYLLDNSNSIKKQLEKLVAWWNN
ncbi:ribulose-phosphate 3-epimerase [Spiroplasma platyhelix]|uniref:Ribulose-phosphate 3-epimerase n=1 Tax=Spiroplasma platyhelix PALS-1 TaxID=1276218 RepID=A0A846U8R7_9MOLU|nr:ribulose-phosphate 3-epimerase [Spiroplasma platyhelix]MBE4703900.1 Ribulose-phosphate 3-epimerase [Spiroplasma platyhelix PALS-1]NKE38273.1 ribulose-phosphate 3-epimerase [Spiroplasma platyhelix PALS-1]UJB29158.1 ribulose-phosphate 3-epimerase [Spiroplasma platyhelix PALS-1]